MIPICYDKNDNCMQSLTHYYGHLVIVHRTLKLLCFKAIVRHCIVLSCGTIIKSLHLVKFVSRLTMLIEKYLVFPSGVVIVQCMQLMFRFSLKIISEKNVKA